MRNRLIEEYSKQLRIAIETHPEEYHWPISELDNVLRRMIPAIDKMSFNKDSIAWKQTCKALGIKHTYQAIKAYRDGVPCEA